MLGWFRRRRFDAVEAFGRFVTQRRPHWRIIGVENDMLQVEMAKDSPAGISVDRIREFVGRNSEESPQCAHAFEELLSVLDSAERDTKPLDLDRDRARLRPRLVSNEVHQAMKRGPTPVSRRLPEVTLWVVYVLDSEHSVIFLTEGQLADLGIDEEQLHTIAMENLSNAGFREIVRNVVEKKQAASVKYLDSYDAARLLLIPETLNEGEAVAACIPDRDTLFLCPIPENERDWSKLGAVAKAPASDRLILDRPICVTRSGFELR